MDPIELSITIDRPREEVFEYLADIANHPEFTDHYLKEWHLTRVDSYGRGAGARFRTDAPRQRFSWGDMSFVTVEPPRRIVGVGRGGKFNRIKTFAEWTLEPAGPRHPGRVHVRDRAGAADRSLHRGASATAAGCGARRTRASSACAASSRTTRDAACARPSRGI